MERLPRVSPGHREIQLLLRSIRGTGRCRDLRGGVARPLHQLSEGREPDLKPVFKFQDNSGPLLPLQEDFSELLGLFPALFIVYSAFSALKQEVLLEATEFPVVG